MEDARNMNMNANMNMNLGPRTSSASAQEAEFEAAEDCVICLKRFHAFRRKHRCQTCGRAVCGSCAKTHKASMSSARVVGEVARMCDHCLLVETNRLNEQRRQEDIERARARQLAAMEEEQRMRDAEIMRREQLAAEKRAREEMARKMRLRDLEQRHFGGPNHRGRPLLTRCRSLDDSSNLRSHHSMNTENPIEQEQRLMEAFRRSTQITRVAAASAEDEQAQAQRQQEQLQNQQLLDEAPMAMSVSDATLVPLVEECAICLEELSAGNAMYTTACGHTFHWQCLKQTERSDTSNFGSCPSCRAEMPEMKTKRDCDHPRVRAGHRFCRDCGQRVTERDAKPRASSIQQQAPPPNRPAGGMLPPTMSYRAGLHGALVRCPQCQMQMRVLPHMYNMRVRCTRGHIFFVQVAGQQQQNSWSRRPSVPTPLGGTGIGRLGAGPSAYPRGVFLYRPTANASQM